MIKPSPPEPSGQPVARPPLSAIIPTWNALRYLPACLMALQSQLMPDKDEIILVDNGSQRNMAADWARAHAPHVRLVVLPYNRGFAGGTNAGLLVARYPLLLLCNDDALMEPGCIAALWDAMRGQPNVGAVAGALTFSRAPSLVASAGIKMQRDGVATDHALGTPTTDMPASPVEVFGASGGLALLQRSLLDDIGLFDETFFCYLEDVDLAWRARLREWRCVLAPAAQARHVSSASGSGFKQRLLARNRWRVLIRCLPAALLLECLPAILRYDNMALAYAALKRQPAIAAGRFEALHELPQLLQQRRPIQASRTAPLHELARWLEPVPSLLAALSLQRNLARYTQG